MNTSVQHILSVMVVTLNEERHIAGLKAALDRLHLPEGWRLETILVDGGSGDATVEAAREAGFEECIVLPGASIPVCRNRALQAARGAMLAFLDGDCVPDRDWFREVLPWLQKPGPVLLGYPVHPPESGNWIQRSWHAHWRHKHGRHGAGKPEPVSRGAFRLITTRNMLFNRALLDVVSSFDETLTTGEDTDFVFRATVAGCGIVALPSLRVTHMGEPSTLREYFRQQLWHANRKAYGTILKSTGGKTGANAIFFSIAFLGGLILATAGLVLGVVWSPWALLLLAPTVFVTAVPAALIADRVGSPLLFLRLCVLYFLYGLARSVDLVGLSPHKKSWKI
ncbi:MAG: glycosyltransferase [Lentisphaerae bacterium]|nr:glycosyltransferase [Lentisphaerota bacterium]